MNASKVNKTIFYQFFLGFPLFLVQEMWQRGESLNLVGASPAGSTSLLLHGLDIKPTHVHVVGTRAHTPVLQHTDIKR